MNQLLADYQRLIASFTRGLVDADEFVSTYLERFKHEQRPMDEATFDCLDTLFGDADSFTRDAELIQSRPNFYLDEQALRERAAAALIQLGKIA